MLIKIPKSKKQKFQLKILNWYKKNKRDLPWRKTTDPYRILVSEVMLQQTQVDRVIPKYQAWIKTFPNFKALAKAPLKKVLQHWSGLGYNSRAVRLQKLAQEVMNNHQGKFPTDEHILLKLPGIGPYTARSVLIFANNKDIGTVDTNIRRIFIHEFNLSQELSDNDLMDFAYEVVPKGRSCDWHNALMDYGSTYLTSRRTGIKPQSTQSTFKGSKRMYRGKILKILLNEQKTITELQKACQKEEMFIRGILEDMKKAGLIQIKRNIVSIN